MTERMLNGYLLGWWLFSPTPCGGTSEEHYRKRMKQKKLSVFLKETEIGIMAQCPELGIASDGNTEAEAKSNLLDLIIFHWNHCVEENDWEQLYAGKGGK